MLRFLAAIAIALGCVAGFFAILGAWILLSTPRPNDIRGCIVTKMYAVRLCPKEAAYVPIGQIAPIVRQAVVASEDGAFYDHHGFDWFELRESFERNWDEGRWARGGSTITQQLAKNVYLTKEKSILRKLREALIVVQLEKSLAKDEILEKYLNVVELGPQIYGVGPASAYYFKKRPAQLDAVEASFLAFLLPNPTKYASSFHAKKLTKFARAQIRAILDRLWKMKRLTDEQHQASLTKLETLFGVAPDMKDEGAAPGDDDAAGPEDADGLDATDRPEKAPSERPADAIPETPRKEGPASGEDE
jgi:monofunctional biosynthetic peptidoglycan transglycosylase